ncbi:MAG TPA: hypothetical protein VGC72_08010 [Candidatus Elarobacter sp.]|jgi:hypothetical protein
MSAFTLAQQGTTQFYAPAANSRFAFLLWSNLFVPKSLDVGDTAGIAPAYAGWFLFGPEPASWTGMLETALRKVLTAPVLTSFAWFDSTTVPAIAGRIDAVVSADAPPRSVSQDDVVFAGSVEIGAGAPIELLTPDERVGFGFTYPPIAVVPPAPPLPPPLGPALTVWLKPGDGDLAGTFRFTGLYPFTPGLQNVADVSVDPLAVNDPTRTFVRFTGQRFGLRKAGNHYELDPV